MTPQTKERAKLAVLAVLCLFPPMMLFLLYLAYHWFENEAQVDEERRHGIHRQPGDVCARCGQVEAWHNEFIGAPSGCMRFRLGRAGA